MEILVSRLGLKISCPSAGSSYKLNIYNIDIYENGIDLFF